MTVTYCERWDRVRHAPVIPLDEAAARVRFEQGPWFSVVLPDEDDPGVPDVVLEIDAGLTTVTVLYFATGGALVDTYVFRRRGDRLFLAEATALTYADGGRGLVACERHDLVAFDVDGSTDHLIDIRGDDGVGWAAGTFDPATHWEPLPAFGDWAGLARFDR